MIIYGTKGSLVRTESVPGVACPACTNAEQMQFSVFSRYAHVYWIPLAPYNKPTVAHCQRCQHSWELSELPAEAAPQVRQAMQALKKETVAPWWHWSGLALLALTLASGTVVASLDEKNNASYLAAPHAGDIYTIRDEETPGRYSLLKVVSAQGNTVELLANEYSMNDAHPLAKLNYPDKFNKESFSLTQLDLLTMKNKGVITDVDRLDE